MKGDLSFESPQAEPQAALEAVQQAAVMVGMSNWMGTISFPLWLIVGSQSLTFAPPKYIQMFSRHLDPGSAEAASQVSMAVAGFEPHSYLHFLLLPALLLPSFILSISSVFALYHLLFFSFHIIVSIYPSVPVL